MVLGPIVDLSVERRMREYERERLEEKERKWKDGDAGDWTQEQIEKLFAVLGGKGVAGRIATGAAKVSVEEIMRVDRTISAGCPDWLELVRPELEKTGPAEYPISQIEARFHEYQHEWHGIKGRDLYSWLMGNNYLKDCLSFGDLKAIQNTSLAFFRQHFSDCNVMAWKSIAQHRDQAASKNLLVPTLRVEDKRELVIHWDSISYMLRGGSPCFILREKR